MDTRTEATTGSVAVMVAGAVIWFVHVFVCEGDFFVDVESVWVEEFGVGIVVFVVVEAPDIDDQGCAFGEEFSINPFIYSIYRQSWHT